jgi:hypothetical protein
MASFVLPLISGLAGLFGGGKQQQTTSNGSQQTSGATNTNSGTTNTQNTGFNYNPQQQSLINNFTNSANNQLKNGTDLTSYTQGGLQQIGQGGNAAGSAIANNLASRGLSFSPAAATANTQNQLNTINQQQGFLQQVPLLQNQLQSQAQANAEAALKAQGVNTTTTGGSQTSGGTTTSGNTNYNGTQTQTGNPMGGLFGGLGAGLAAPNGSGGMNIGSLLQMLGLVGGGQVGGYGPQNIPGLGYQGN